MYIRRRRRFTTSQAFVRRLLLIVSPRDTSRILRHNMNWPSGECTIAGNGKQQLQPLPRPALTERTDRPQVYSVSSNVWLAFAVPIYLLHVMTQHVRFIRFITARLKSTLADKRTAKRLAKKQSHESQLQLVRAKTKQL